MTKMDTKTVMAEVASARKIFKDACKAAIEVLFVEFFDKYPEVRTIYWNQNVPWRLSLVGTTFCVQDVGFSPREWSEIEYAMENEDMEVVDGAADLRDYGADGKWDNHQPTPEAMITDIKRLKEYLESDLLSQAMEDAYGSGSFVRVHRNGVETEDYSDY